MNIKRIFEEKLSKQKAVQKKPGHKKRCFFIGFFIGCREERRACFRFNV